MAIPILQARPAAGRRWSRLLLMGPAFVAAIAYVDPGNVAANLTAGASYGYLLVWVLVAANAMAVLVQYQSAKLGLATGLSLPEILGKRLGNGKRRMYWLQAEVVAGATDMAEVIGLRADLSFLRGTGAASEPTGIRNIAGVNVVSSGVNGATPTYDSLMDLVSPHRTANSRFDSPGWIFNGRLLTTLEKVKDTNGRYLKEAGLLEFDPTGNTGKLLGFPFRVSNQIPVTLTTGSSSDCSEIYFSSSWSEAWIGQEQTLAIDVSREASYWDGSAWVSAWTNRQHVFRAVWTVDFNLRRPGLFSVLTGVRP